MSDPLPAFWLDGPDPDLGNAVLLSLDPEQWADPNEAEALIYREIMPGLRAAFVGRPWDSFTRDALNLEVRSGLERLHREVRIYYFSGFWRVGA